MFELGREGYRPGQLVVYCNGGEDHVGGVEIGVVKRVMDDGCFVAYGTGDTCAKTPYNVMLPVENGYAAEALVQRMRQLGEDVWPLMDGCEVWSCE